MREAYEIKYNTGGIQVVIATSYGEAEEKFRHKGYGGEDCVIVSITKIISFYEPII